VSAETNSTIGKSLGKQRSEITLEEEKVKECFHYKVDNNEFSVATSNKTFDDVNEEAPGLEMKG
jgi:hypothetical protein